jgi:hypothetical protein
LITATAQSLNPVKCPNPNCAKENADDHQFCAYCGSGIKTDLRAIVDDIIKERLKDREVVEVETAAAITKRMWDWAEAFGKWVGIPLAILVIVFALLGITSFRDIEKQGDEARSSISNFVSQVSNQVNELKATINLSQTNISKAAEISDQLIVLRTRLTNAEASFADFESLSNRINSIEQAFGEHKLPPELEIKYENYLRPFRNYLTNLGFQIPTQKLEIYYTAKKGREDDDSAYAGPPYKQVWGIRLFLHPEFRETPDSLLQTYVHYFLHEGGRVQDSSSVEASLAYYYSASFTENPEPFPVRERALNGAGPVNLLNSFEINVNALDTSQWWTNSLALAGLYWELRSKAGKPTIDRILRDCWNVFEVDFRTGETDRGIKEFLRCIASQLEAQAPNLVSDWKGMAMRRRIEW